jgi:hypothetical protein
LMNGTFGIVWKAVSLLPKRGRSMAKTTDLKSVQAALDRAATKAVSGPKDARAGRFASSESGKAPRSVAASALSHQPTKRK